MGGFRGVDRGDWTPTVRKLALKFVTEKQDFLSISW